MFIASANSSSKVGTSVGVVNMTNWSPLQNKTSLHQASKGLSASGNTGYTKEGNNMFPEANG